MEDGSWKTALMERFPDRWHESKTLKGNTITFVSWHHYADQLDSTLGPEGWLIEEPKVTVTPNRVIVAVGLTIPGVGTKWNVGDEVLDKDSFGTASTNAFAQAFKRAAAMWGLGRYMYEKDEVYDSTPAAQVHRRRTEGDEAHFSAATHKQKEMIFKLMQSHVFTDTERGEIILMMKEHGTTKLASEIIDDLLTKIKERKAKEAADLAKLNEEAAALMEEEA